MELKFHNGECRNLKSGDKVHLTGCNGFWTVVGVRDHHAIKVQPEDLNDDPIWVDSDEITDVITDGLTRLPAKPTDEMTCAVDHDDCATPDAAWRAYCAMVTAFRPTETA